MRLRLCCSQSELGYAGGDIDAVVNMVADVWTDSLTSPPARSKSQIFPKQ